MASSHRSRCGTKADGEGAHRAGSPRIGFEDIAEPQVLVRWPGVTLGRVPGQQPMAEEVAVDVGNPCSMLRSDFTEFGVQLGQDSDDLRPRRQPHPRGISRAVTGS
jgi:hypothetical protein